VVLAEYSQPRPGSSDFGCASFAPDLHDCGVTKQPRIEQQRKKQTDTESQTGSKAQFVKGAL
jgi:hypothetical protein